VKNVENVLNIMFANQKSVMEHLLPPVKVIQESLNRGKEMTEMNRTGRINLLIKKLNQYHKLDREIDYLLKELNKGDD
jgi:hypothetical protein